MIHTVGILYPGEMGASLASVLQESGYRTVATTGGRSERTRELCRRSNIQVLPSLSNVIAESQIVISLVPPAAAWEVALECRQHMAQGDGAKLFVDANSVSPLTSRKIAALFETCKIGFVDASIHGLASQLKQRGTLFLSGTAAKDIASCFAGLARVVVIGAEAGQASTLKMLLGGMSKGIVALFIEMSLAAHRAGLLDELLANCRIYYPGLMEALDRLLPTYPRHALRRADELDELASMLLALGLPAGMLGEARQTMAHLAGLALHEQYPTREAEDWDPESVVRTICRHSEPSIDASDAPPFPETQNLCHAVL